MFFKKRVKEERDLSLQRKKSYRRTRSLSTTTRPLSSTSLLKQLVIKNNLVCTICKTYELAKIIKPSNINLELIIYPSLTLQSQSYCVHLRHTLYAWKKHLLGQPFDSKQRWKQGQELGRNNANDSQNLNFQYKGMIRIQQYELKSQNI